MSTDKITINTDEIEAVTSQSPQHIVTRTTDWSTPPQPVTQSITPDHQTQSTQNTCVQPKQGIGCLLTLIIVLNFLLTLGLCGGVGYLLWKQLKNETKKDGNSKPPAANFGNVKDQPPIIKFDPEPNTEDVPKEEPQKEEFPKEESEKPVEKNTTVPEKKQDEPVTSKTEDDTKTVEPLNLKTKN
ncbi:MAG: hypothetical protein LBG58_07625 [Planctomycetaceae bacterium]|jgi:hypothetical protein|nr:hypothetical protein [Planctomycetaceae bacterium]